MTQEFPSHSLVQSGALVRKIKQLNFPFSKVLNIFLGDDIVLQSHTMTIREISD